MVAHKKIIGKTFAEDVFRLFAGAAANKYKYISEFEENRQTIKQ